MSYESKPLGNQPAELPLDRLSIKNVQSSPPYAAAPSPTASIPQRNSLGSEKRVQLSFCRSCSGHFSYDLPKGGTVTIVAGIPPENLKFKAISHVWGPSCIVDMHCQNCSQLHYIRLRSASTFYHIMELAGPDSSIWMDNMSIDQNNPSDVTAQIAVMGEIYSKAQCVSVLLPETDKEAHTKITRILGIAEKLLARKGLIQYSYENVEDDGIIQEIKKLGEFAKAFFMHIRDLQSSLDKFTYWKRAWTFQEWALAFDVEITVDEYNVGALNHSILRQVKSKIVYVAILIADYKLRKGQYALMDVGFSRGLAAPRLQQVKRIFPFEDAFASYNEISEFEVNFQTLNTNQGTDAILGLRPNPRKPRTAKEQFLNRLTLMLDSFASMSKREATFEADLVCCWASMCNIKYEYSKEDSFETALTKVIRTLRETGITIYNFIVTKENVQDIDFEFLSYASAHVQLNATNRAFFPGIPILTGRVDTVTHFCSTLQAVQKESGSPESVTRLDLQRISEAVIKMAVSLSKPALAISALELACSGKADGIIFTDILQEIWTLLQNYSDSFLSTRMLVIAAIPLHGETSDPYHFNAWAICASKPFTDEPPLFIAREGLNGALVLARHAKNVSDAATVVSYLTISDQQSGTFLIPVSNDGQILLTLKTPQRSDVLNAELMADRELRASVKFMNNRQSAEETALGSVFVFESRQELPSISHVIAEWFYQDNNLAIQSSSDHQTITAEMLRELLKRKIGGRETMFDRDGKSAVDIDIGHPELVSKDQENTDRRTFHRLLRRSSMSTIEDTIASYKRTSPFTVDTSTEDID